MGHILFWLEAAVTSVLFVAMGLRILSGIQRRGRRWLVRIAWIILAPLPWVAAIGEFAEVQFFTGGALAPLISASVAGGLVAIAAIVMIRRNRRPAALDGRPAAAGWRLGRLSLIWAVSLLLTCITFWNLDLAVRQEMATLRIEAGALALSVSPPRIPDAQNAAILYRQAWEILDAQKDGNVEWGKVVAGWLQPDKGDFDPNNKQMLDFLAKQGPVIELLHKAGQLPACNFGTQYNPPAIDVLLPPLGKVRDLARLLWLSAGVHADQGRMVDAMKDLSASFALADHCTAEPPLVTLLVAIAIDAKSVNTLQQVLEKHAPTSESLNALKLNSAFSFTAALQRSLRMEKAFGLSFFTTHSPSAAFADVSLPAPRTYVTDTLANPYRVFFWSQDVAAYLRWMNRIVTLSGQPCHEARVKWNELDGDMEKAANARGLGGLLAAVITPALSRAATLVARADAQHQLALLGVALWQYRLDHGAFPDKLDSLTPKYILAVPTDPFTGQGMKLARKADGQCVIYSVGSDLQDDGGTPFDRKTEKGDISLTLGK
ncbi:MAG: hypothetical protein WC869_13005 [Phycisphaerae bacterium]|jgi:hypothetical protein